EIFSGAFDFTSITGGVGGYAMIRAMRSGVSRGLLSNEAGCGTAPTAHAASDEKLPAVQGCYGIFEVFADTILLCSMTAAVVLIHGNTSGLDGIPLALASYESGAGIGAGIFLAVSVILFAFATLVCWSFYGCEAVGFLTYNNKWKKIYLCLFCLSVPLGAVVGPSFVWDSADICVGLMTIVNCICLVLLGDLVVNEIKKL
nr:alanine:cation symporter family protein [Clostridia bacterium]